MLHGLRLTIGIHPFGWGSNAEILFLSVFHLHALVLLGEHHGEIPVFLLDLAYAPLDQRHQRWQSLAHRELGEVPLEQPHVLPRRHTANLRIETPTDLFVFVFQERK